jgi:CubicO group peptidase (beta-lactamase class C family)
MPLVQGTTTERFAVLRDMLEENLSTGVDVGASLAVVFHGEFVADLWGGYRDRARTIPWDADTLVNVWSSTKTMTFLVALMLADRGELDFDAPVATYWPEFARHGKSSILVRHVMGHTAGLAGWDPPFEPESLANWEFATSALADQAPWWEDRTQSGYHACTQGYLIGELVRRITGTTIGRFLRSEVTNVLGADFFIGLPQSEESRVSLVIPMPASDPATLPLIDGALAADSVAFRALSSPPLDATYPQHRWWRAAEIPATNGHGNAHSVALVQQIIANNGHAGGHRIFSEKTGERIFQSQALGQDLVLGREINFGLGYALASPTVPIGPRTCFWMGYGGSLVIMDQDLELTVTYMMNQMRVGLAGDTRGFGFAMAAFVAAMG